MSFFNNSNGGSVVTILKGNIPTEDILQISSSNYTNNVNGGLKIVLSSWLNEVTLHRLLVMGNKGAFAEDTVVGNDATNQGTSVLIILRSLVTSKLNLSYCNICGNIGSKGSIVYIAVGTVDPATVSIISST